VCVQFTQLYKWRSGLYQGSYPPSCNISGYLVITGKQMKNCCSCLSNCCGTSSAPWAWYSPTCGVLALSHMDLLLAPE